MQVAPAWTYSIPRECGAGCVALEGWGWEQGGAVGVEAEPQGTESSYRGSAAAGSGLRPAQRGSLSPGSSLELGQKPKGFCGQGRSNLWGAAANTSLCSPSHGLCCHRDRAVRNILCSPSNLLPTGGAGRAQPKQRGSCFMAHTPRPHHPAHSGAPKVNPFPRTVHSHISTLWREDNWHPHTFHLSSTPSAPSLTCGSLCQQPNLSNSSVIF